MPSIRTMAAAATLLAATMPATAQNWPTRPVTIRTMAAAATLLAATMPATAQNWPTRPVTMVISFAAGSSIDVVGRLLAPRLSELLGQQVVVENVTGAAGIIGNSRVAKAAPDGYQFVLGATGGFAQNQSLYKNLPYNAATDFAPVALLAETPPVLVARKDLPAGNLKDFIAYAKANQAKMQYGSSGAGTSTHLACVLLNAAIGVSITHIPYRGGGPAMQDLIAGRIDYQCPLSAVTIPQIESKTVTAIAILAKERSRILPEVATAHEQGLTDFDSGSWFAFPPQSHARADRAEAQRGHGRDIGYAVRAAKTF